jgi:hypothetical protein
MEFVAPVAAIPGHAAAIGIAAIDTHTRLPTPCDRARRMALPRLRWRRAAGACRRRMVLRRLLRLLLGLCGTRKQ